MQTPKIGIREFRAGLAGVIAADVPVAVTRHGQTVGFFIPAHGHSDADVAALKKAAAELDRLLAGQGVDPDAVADEFRTVRRAARPRQRG